MLNVNTPIPDLSNANLTLVSGITEDSCKPIFREDFISNSWSLIFFWPFDFTFVCPTEIIGYDNLYHEFSKRNTKIYGVSIDSIYTHMAWKKSREDLLKVKIPFISDVKRIMSFNFDVLNQDGVANRATYLINPTGIIKYAEMTDIKVGRNPDEALRILDALQTDKLCPCKRNIGGETI